MNVNVAIIPARGGSRRIPRKNIREFFGKPIIAYSIEAARKSGLFDRIFVSTEDPEITNIALSYEADVLMRPPFLAQDSVGTQEVMRCELAFLCKNQIKNGLPLSIDYACCIYATAPLLEPFDLMASFAALPGHPYSYVPGIFYWGQTIAFLSDVPLSLGFEAPYPQERYIDINTPEDFSRAEKVYAALHGLNPT